MDKMKMHTANKADENFKKLAALFPNAVTETIAGYDENGKAIIERAIDKDVLMQEISSKVVEENEERYQFTWPDKKKSVLLANAPTNKTLRPVRQDQTVSSGTDSNGNPYCSTGSVDFDNTENLYIEGDNLEVLKLLQETYLGKIKMIYIDPPYNTGHDFVYEDDFTQRASEYLDISGQLDEDGNKLVQNTESNGRFHTDWLNMLYPRLKLAKDLLSKDGVIFISIDDKEVENTRKVCDEIFNQTNFVAMLSVENNPKGRKNSSFISVSSEYCIIYAKEKKNSYFIENVPKKASDMILDEDGKYVHNSGKRVLVGENSFNKFVSLSSSDKNYSVYFKRKDYSLIIRKEVMGEIDQELIQKGYVKYYSYRNNKLVENTYTEEKFRELFNAKALSFTSDKVYEKNFNDTIRMKSQLVNKEYEAIVHGKKEKFSMDLTTTGAGTYLKKLFELSEVPFSAPKNIGFLRMLVSLLGDSDFICLDFFSGSASTADAVMRLNAEDGGKRKFIMVQLPEKTDEKSEAYKAGYQNICEIGKERIRRAARKIAEENPEAKFDGGFRVLKCDSSNMKDVYYQSSEYEPSLFSSLENNIKEDRTPEDLLFQVMLDLGVLLSGKIEETTIAGKKVFNVEDNYLIACFDDNVTDEVITEIAKQQPYYFVMRDSSMASDSVATNFEQIFATYSPSTERRVL